MGDMKHSPGPWLHCLDHNGRHEIRKSGMHTLASVFHTPDGLAAANASLISAAPDLLEACREILRTGLDEEAMHGDQREAVNLARAAIAKAERC